MYIIYYMLCIYLYMLYNYVGIPILPIYFSITQFRWNQVWYLANSSSDIACAILVAAASVQQNGLRPDTDLVAIWNRGVPGMERFQKMGIKLIQVKDSWIWMDLAQNTNKTWGWVKLCRTHLNLRMVHHELTQWICGFIVPEILKFSKYDWKIGDPNRPIGGSPCFAMFAVASSLVLTISVQDFPKFGLNLLNSPFCCHFCHIWTTSEQCWIGFPSFRSRSCAEDPVSKGKFQWTYSFVKLRAAELFQYQRIIYFDVDAFPLPVTKLPWSPHGAAIVSCFHWESGHSVIWVLRLVHIGLYGFM